MMFSKTIYNVQATFDLQGHPVIGDLSDSALDQVVIISDYKCPNCKRFDEEVLPRLLLLADRKLINIGFVDKPVLALRMKLSQDDSMLASVAAQCVFEKSGIETYLRLRQELYRIQGAETDVWATDTSLNTAFQHIGLKYKSSDCPNRIAIQRMLKEDISYIDAQRVIGTPAVFINGQRVRNNFKSIKHALNKK